ncbi:MAG: hypothetical protein QXZ09_08655 [Candidatus Methanomethylicaceae archaeon]
MSARPTMGASFSGWEGSPGSEQAALVLNMSQGRDERRWNIGIKLCWLLNSLGRVGAWDWDTMNVYDKRFNPLAQPFIGQTIVLADEGFRDKDGIPENMKICRRGTWNERTYLGTASSLLTVVYSLKKILHRLAEYITNSAGFHRGDVQCALGLILLSPSTH